MCIRDSVSAERAASRCSAATASATQARSLDGFMSAMVPAELDRAQAGLGQRSSALKSPANRLLQKCRASPSSAMPGLARGTLSAEVMRPPLRRRLQIAFEKRGCDGAAVDR